MDIERMHEVIEKLSEIVKCEFDKGTENVDTCEMKEAIDMLKDLSEAIYYRMLTVAMQESGTDEIMEMFDRYGSGKLSNRKAYTEPMYRMPLEIQRNDYKDNYESRYDHAKRMYTETREMHRTGTAEDKQAKIRSLEGYMKELAEDITEIITDMSTEEKNLLRTKMQTLIQRIQ